MIGMGPGRELLGSLVGGGVGPCIGPLPQLVSEEMVEICGKRRAGATGDEFAAGALR